jgi:hypothetical protein
MDNGNGHGAAETERPNGLRAIRITLSPETFEMHLNADNMPLDCAHAMLSQALRYIESKLRQAALLQFAAQQQEAARTAAIVDKVRRGH